VNQPVQDLLTRRCYVTSQNHGYAVLDNSAARRLGALVRQPERRHQRGRPLAAQAFFSVQFHPEASPGPRDTGYLFDDFLRLVGASRRI
jgi:carbamoyl-phosphate synthase small subunit